MAKQRDYLLENDRIELECCTNDDVNPMPLFKWFKVSRKSQLLSRKALSSAASSKNSNKKVYVLSPSSSNLSADEQLAIEHEPQEIRHAQGKVCNVLSINLSRYDNRFIYKCSVSNQALIKPLDDNLMLNVECNNYLFSIGILFLI